MAGKNKTVAAAPLLQFSTAAGTPETKRKMLLYRQLLRQELGKELRKELHLLGPKPKKPASKVRALPKPKSAAL
ncbi:Trim9 [Drosophila busckii]|uniref:Trim9 n=1 Tax=Drosophila busckii TaxID=30019 RepID=A0A0M4E3C8_DROBS|nr:uncharacterized protein LOC108594440 [Drosophila busckii]ALC38096.1 Trim9 [Drosophila busckii]